MSNGATNHDALAQADQAASQRRSSGSPVNPCPFRFALEVKVVSEDDQPLASIPVELRDAEGEALRSKTNGSGLVRFEGLEDAAYRYSLYTLAADAWEVVSQSSLEQPASSSGPAPFKPTAPVVEPETRHKIKEGECTTKLADRFGFSPEAVWEANEALASARTSMNTLAQGDQVVIPAREAKMESGSARNRYVVRRKAPQTWFRVRFLDEDGKPRAGVSYLVSIETLSRKPVPSATGETNDDGIIEVKVPADSTKATIALRDGEEQEEHVMLLSHLEPPDTPRGLQARLRNLGYGCGDEDGAIGPKTRSAVTLFQIDHLLDPSGEATKETLDALVSLHLS